MPIYLGNNNITGGFTTEEKTKFNNSISDIIQKMNYKLNLISNIEELKNRELKKDDFYFLNNKLYKIIEDELLIEDKYVTRIKDNFFAISSDFREDLKYQSYKGVAISISTNQNNYHITQLNNQLTIAKQLNANIQLAVGVNMGDKNVTGEISLCVTTTQLQDIIDIINSNNLKVDMIKLHTQTVQGDWSGVDVIPSDISSFFTKYTTILNDVGEICSLNNIPILVMCNEQSYIISKSFYNYWVTVKETLKNNYPDLLLSISYTLNRMREDLRDYNLAYANSIPRLLDYIGINIYPTVLRKEKRYNYGYMNKNQGLFNQTYSKESLYYKDSYLSIIKQVENFLGKVIITETGCIQYDTTTEIGDMNAISNIDLRTGTQGNDQELYFKEVFPYLNNITNGIYVWGANAPFTPVNGGLNYLNNKLRSDI